MNVARPPVRLNPPTQLHGITDLTVLAELKPGLIDGIFDSRSPVWRLRRVLALLDAARHAARESDAWPGPLPDFVARVRDVHFFRFAILPRSSTGSQQFLLNVTFDGGLEPYMRLIWKPLGSMLDLMFCHTTDYPLAAACSYDDYLRWVRAKEIPSQFFFADSPGTVADRAYLERLEALQRRDGHRPDADLQAARLALPPTAPPTPPSPAAVAASLRTLKALFALLPFFGRAPALADPVPLDDASVLWRFAQDLLADLRGWTAQGLFQPGGRHDALYRSATRELDWLMHQTAWQRPARADRPPVALPRPELPATLSPREALRARVQTGVLDGLSPPPGQGLRGAVALLRVRDAARARRWLAEATLGERPLVSDGRTVTLAGGRIVASVALTLPGLRALGCADGLLDALPADFRQGMAQRAGVLGDLRLNHPQQWQRPLSGALQQPLDLEQVHLLVQLRTVDPETRPDADRSALLPALRQWLDAHTGADDPWQLLAVEPGWSRPPVAGEAAPRNHFGFADGMSQPRLDPAPGAQFWDDGVRLGDVLLGAVNSLGDGPLAPGLSLPPPSDPTAWYGDGRTPAWLCDGSFLVLRKLRLYPQRLDRAVEQAAPQLATSVPDAAAARELVRAKLMGRDSAGRPLAVRRGAGDNDFDYAQDADGAQCPFASHVRRANPRTPSAGGMPVPRIVRRGMSYGPLQAHRPGEDVDRGLMFIAYNANLAEQFETLQRWLSGGNASGINSAQPDPFLGLPPAGESMVHRFVHGQQVVRVDLGTQPLSRLMYGLYAFVPSIDTLRRFEVLVRDQGLAAATAPTPSPVPSTAVATAPAAGGVADAAGATSAPAPDVPPLAVDLPGLGDDDSKRAFEDDEGRRERWQALRTTHGGVQRFGRNVVAGSLATVRAVLADGGARYSAAGYDARMGATVGRCPFGQDHDLPGAPAAGGHARPHVQPLKTAIARAVSEDQACATGFALMQRVLAGMAARGLSAGPGVPVRVDLQEAGLAVLDGLLRVWFGADGGGSEQQPFTPALMPVDCIEAKATATAGGPALRPGPLLSIARYVFSSHPSPVVRAAAQTDGPPLDGLVAAWIERVRQASPGLLPAPVMRAALQALAPPVQAGHITADEERATVAVMILGLPATWLGSFVKVLLAWITDRRLWGLQLDLASRQPTPPQMRALLREPLLRTLVADAVADGIWRQAVAPGPLGPQQVRPGDVVWMGLGSAWADASAQGQADTALALDLIYGGHWDSTAAGHAPHACPGRDMATGTLIGAMAALLAAGELRTTPSATVLELLPA
ncbi:MAG: hypothetical protein RIQ53_2824 [Pseudomonadota bacterium]